MGLEHVTIQELTCKKDISTFHQHSQYGSMYRFWKFKGAFHWSYSGWVFFLLLLLLFYFFSHFLICCKSVVPCFSGNLNITVIGISYFKQISSYCRAMNANVSDFKSFNSIFNSIYSYFGRRWIEHALKWLKLHSTSLNYSILFSAKLLLSEVIHMYGKWDFWSSC